MDRNLLLLADSLVGLCGDEVSDAKNGLLLTLGSLGHKSCINEVAN